MILYITPTPPLGEKFHPKDLGCVRRQLGRRGIVAWVRENEVWVKDGDKWVKRVEL